VKVDFNDSSKEKAEKTSKKKSTKNSFKDSESENCQTISKLLQLTLILDAIWNHFFSSSSSSKLIIFLIARRRQGEKLEKRFFVVFHNDAIHKQGLAVIRRGMGEDR
jgi:hypothetical protein